MKISAKVGPNQAPCCEWVGPAGAGHYVKMVHNGIEYGDMQLICEAYFILKNALGLTNDELNLISTTLIQLLIILIPISLLLITTSSLINLTLSQYLTPVTLILHPIKTTRLSLTELDIIITLVG